jgi:D-beta-D-heptose 7-phosphate kinase/D-beta-D-heptose 1-phosphate adenosyltransferase
MTDLHPFVDQLAGTRVLCVGDIMLDRFISGHVHRISPEAPIPVLRIETESSMLGGAGNVVRNLVSLGAEAVFVSMVGNDQAGREITSLVGELQGVEPHLLVDHHRATTIKTRYVAGNQQLLRADLESSAAVDPEIGEDIAQLAEEAIKDVSVLILSDYAKGVLTADRATALIAAARAADRPVVVDPKGNDYERYKGATVLTPNRSELAQALGSSAGDDAAIEAGARQLIDKLMVEAVLVTRGPDGATLVPAKGDAVHLTPLPGEVFDVSGAGDTLVATLATGLGAGLSIVDAAMLANVAAGIAVGKVGTAVVYAEELKRELDRQHTVAGPEKVVPLSSAVEQVRRWRRQGLKVGFTNGCFDLLHPGHVSLMKQARAACDRLIVGLNSDASVKRLKGKGRPIQNEAARAQVLASLASVDLVVIFAEDTPIALMETLKPDLLVKGADYSLDQVVGADLVRGWGGQVLLAQISPGHSTTATIKRISG